MLVAEAEPGGLVGCVALRGLEPGSCEMKRLFVTGSGRGLGIGKALALAIIDTGRRFGYRRIRLDTMPNQQAAHQLYRELGFVEIDRYRHNPVAGARFLELPL
jgi:GNAT superfamily N-acetyltransferase